MKTTEYYTHCPECGYVVMDQTDDYGPESHSADYEEKTRNTRASGFTSFSLHNYGLRTEIGFGSRDYSGKSIDSHIAEHMNNMRKWHSRIRVASPKERRLSNVLSKINETCSAMSLPKTVVETAAVLYRNFDSRNKARGKSVACMAVATIYLACKRCSIVRSLEEIVNAASITDKDRSSLKLAAKYYRFMVMETGIFIEQSVTSLSSSPSSGTTTAPSILSYPLTQTGPIPVTLAIDQYISKLANVAKIDTKVERLAIDIAHKTDDHLLADGKAPNGLAAAYIYLASMILGVNILQRDISSLSGVTEVTIRNRCKDILTSFKLTITVKQQQIRPSFA